MKKRMSAELAAMLKASERQRKETRPPQNGEYSRREYALELKANRRLAKAGFFQPKAEAEVIPADCCGTHGLRPTWHGRAS